MRESLKHSLRSVRGALRSLNRDIADSVRHGNTLRKAAAGKTELRLNIGCGHKIEDGWLNLDIEPASSKVYYFNALNPLPIDDDAVARIHCEHFLEHLDSDQARSFLKECWRALRPKGSMRIIVPDLEKYIRAYASSDEEFFRKLNRLGGSARVLETKGIICNQMCRMGGGHKFAWDFETLALVGRQVGFSTIERSAWKQAGGGASIDGEEEWRVVESLYCELHK